MNLRQAAQRALKAMEGGEYRADMIEFSDALVALRAALAEPEQEPVAWMWKDGTVTTDPDRADGTWTPLYTVPTPRKPLTDDEIAQAMFRAHAIVTGPTQFRFAREIERAHGIGDSNGS